MTYHRGHLSQHEPVAQHSTLRQRELPESYRVETIARGRERGSRAVPRHGSVTATAAATAASTITATTATVDERIVIDDDDDHNQYHHSHDRKRFLGGLLKPSWALLGFSLVPLVVVFGALGPSCFCLEGSERPLGAWMPRLGNEGGGNSHPPWALLGRSWNAVIGRSRGGALVALLGLSLSLSLSLLGLSWAILGPS